MNANNFSIDALLKMVHSPIHNYIVPGLTSWLIGAPSPQGTVRLFHMSREQQEGIAPHSHRFDFQCWVLSGRVRNRLWTRDHYARLSDHDTYKCTRMIYLGEPGRYRFEPLDDWTYTYADSTYAAGDCYSMEHDEIHSIHFSRGARVLFLEGPQLTDTSIVLEPVTEHGGHVPTAAVLPWMFLR